MSLKERTYDEFKIGEKIVTPAITITDAHMTIFTSLVGDFDPIHIDEEYCKNTPFKTRVAPGHLTVSMVDGMLDPMFRKTVVALLGISYRFRAPVKIGDTIHAEAEVVEKRPSKTYPNAGIVKFKVECINQKKEIVAEGEYTVLSLKERKQ